MMSKRLSDNASYSVSLMCCTAIFLRYCEAKAYRALIVIPAQNGKPFVPAACCFFERPAVCRSVLQPFIFTKSVRRAASLWGVFDRRGNRLRRQFGAALSAAALDNKATAFCSHARTEAVSACAL